MQHDPFLTDVSSLRQFAQRCRELAHAAIADSELRQRLIAFAGDLDRYAARYETRKTVSLAGGDVALRDRQAPLQHAREPPREGAGIGQLIALGDACLIEEQPGEIAERVGSAVLADERR